MKAHRAAYIFAHGTSPGCLLVLHKCDNPLCCNPNHLFLGTPQDNMTDKVVKGRHRYPVGESHYKARLTESDVRDIRKLWDEGYMLKEIAPIYGMSSKSLHHITSRKTWKHVV